MAEAASQQQVVIQLDWRVEIEVARYVGFVNQALAAEAALKDRLPLKVTDAPVCCSAKSLAPFAITRAKKNTGTRGNL